MVLTLFFFLGCLPDFWVRVKPSNMRWYISASSLGQSGVSLAPCDLNWLWIKKKPKKQRDMVTEHRARVSFLLRPAGPSQLLTLS